MNFPLPVGAPGRHLRRIGWVIANTSSNVASTRYRCYYPAMALAELGIESVVFSRSRDAWSQLDRLDAFVFVKGLDSLGVALAAKARSEGKRVYMDLCDNTIIPSYGAGGDERQIPSLVALSSIADAIVTTNRSLSESLRTLFSASANFCEIPDQIETRTTVEQAARFSQLAVSKTGLRKRLQWLSTPRVGAILKLVTRDPLQALSVACRKLSKAGQRLKVSPRSSPAIRSESRAKSCKRVLWFGRYGAAYSDFGMLSLLRAASALEKVAHDVDFELLVISNNRQMFDNWISPLSLPTRYIEWAPNAVFDALAETTVCLFPSGKDSFSSTKSANRAVLALSHGVPVISSRMVSLEPLAESIAFDAWEDALRRFLGSDGECRRAVEKARPVIATVYSPQAIAGRWMELLRDGTPKRAFGMRNKSTHLCFGIVLDRTEDIDLLLPIIDECGGRKDIDTRVIVTDRAIQQSPLALRTFIDRDIVPYYMTHRAIFAGESGILKELDCLLTGTADVNTDLGAVNTLRKHARTMRVPTFALLAEQRHSRPIHVIDDRGEEQTLHVPLGAPPSMVDAILANFTCDKDSQLAQSAGANASLSILATR